MKTIKRIVTALTVFAVGAILSLTPLAADVNVDNQDSSSYGAAVGDSYKIGEGVRISIYTSLGTKTGKSIDFTKDTTVLANETLYHYFCTKSGNLLAKTEWVLGGLGSTIIDYEKGTNYEDHLEYLDSLPKITPDPDTDDASAVLATLKSVLGDKAFLQDITTKYFSDACTYDELAPGMYKLVFEPVAYFKYNGSYWAMTATEVIQRKKKKCIC